ncbi:Uncharacterised protein [Vibrio cholerae]|nr:Uncharacterised protein [Vibrio cholerae]
MDRADHQAIHLIFVHITHKNAINFDDIDRQFLQITERGEPRAKIIQSQHAT